MFLIAAPLWRFPFPVKNERAFAVLSILRLIFFVGSAFLMPAWAVHQAVTNKGTVTKGLIWAEGLLACVWAVTACLLLL
jgi:hypothetical protein